MNLFKSKNRIRKEKESLLAKYIGECDALIALFNGMPFIPMECVRKISELEGKINQLKEELRLTEDEILEEVKQILEK